MREGEKEKERAREQFRGNKSQATIERRKEEKESGRQRKEITKSDSIIRIE